jgi:hypothetical protein
MREELALFLFLIVIVSLILIFYHTSHKSEGFTGHRHFVNRQHKQFNNIGITLKNKKNAGILGISANDILNTYKFPQNTPLAEKRDGLWASIDKCEAVNTMDCNAFDDPEFSRICGMCLDIGKNSDNVPATGGLVLLSDDRNLARESASSNYLPDYIPTVGFCPAGKMVSTKAECLKLQRQLLCRKNSSYDLDSCSQCYSDTNYSIVDPKTSPGVITGSGHILVVGQGMLKVQETGFAASSEIKLHASKPHKVNIKGRESTRIKFTLTPVDVTEEEEEDIPYMAGILNGDTNSGVFSSDLRRIVLVDEVTGRKPRSYGKTTIDGMPSTRMAPGFDKDAAVIVIIVPFTFVETTMEESSKCKDAPFITTQAAAEFLESDPCYKKGSGPGKFSLECLQGLWDDNGCITDGKGYPGNTSTASALMTSKNGKFLTLNQIADYIYNMAIITSTGVDENGKSQPMKEWSDASVFCTGREITSPCDTPAKNRGPLSPACIIHLWNNQSSKKTWQGFDDPIGPTYFASNAVSLFKQGDVQRSCQATGTLSPVDKNGKNNRTVIRYWQKQGGVNNVKLVMANLHRAANAQIAADDYIAPYFKQCYGDVPFAPRPLTLFNVPNNKLPETYRISRNNTLLSSLNMTQDYKLQFVIRPRGIQGNWGSIIHFTSNDTDCCSFGSRTPAIWFWPGDLRLHVRIGAPSDGNWGIDIPGCQMNKESSFILECRGNSVTITLDGKVYSATHPNYRYSGNVKVYGSNPWYPEAIADIKDVGLQLFGNSTSTNWIETLKNPNNNGWIQKTGGLTNITISENGTVYGVNAHTLIYRCTNMQSANWEQFQGGGRLKQVAAQGNGGNTIIGIGTDDNIYRGDGNPANPQWVKLQSRGNKQWSAGGRDGWTFNIARGGGNNIFFTDGGNGGSGDWNIPGGLAMIAYGVNELWGVGEAGHVYRYNGTMGQLYERCVQGKQNGTDWAPIPTPTDPPGLGLDWAKYIAVSPNGKRIVATGKEYHKIGNPANALYAWDNGKWIPVGGAIGQVAICDTMIVWVDKTGAPMNQFAGNNVYYMNLPPG